jgi:Rrf2 family nitric oxide-sensitive transcriptional repressor
MQKLASNGFVATRRGGGGGAMLARPADQIRLGAIVGALEDGYPLVECFAADGGNCSIDGQCRLKSRLRAAEMRFLQDLDRSTLADIALTPAPAD